MPGSFIDSNVLAYLASGDPAKADRAERIIADGGTISVQVLNELANVARRKMRMTWPKTHALLSMIRALLPVQPMTVETHETGLELAERYGLSICDAMIAAANVRARGGNCLKDAGGVGPGGRRSWPEGPTPPADRVEVAIGSFG
jgi:predicted nucleic acid-binding protein